MNKQNTKGKLFVIVGPSGVGKGTILGETLKRLTGIKYSVSATTRPARPGEVDGVNYNFFSKDKFKKLIENEELLEWAEFANNYYGTYEKTVKDTLEEGTDIILEIEIQGALQIKKKMPEAIMILILPPSLEELRERLEGRNTETKEVIERRLAIAKKELSYKDKFKYHIINEKVNEAVSELEKAILKERNAK